MFRKDIQYCDNNRLYFLITLRIPVFRGLFEAIKSIFSCSSSGNECFMPLDVEGCSSILCEYLQCCLIYHSIVIIYCLRFLRPYFPQQRRYIVVAISFWNNTNSLSFITKKVLIINSLPFMCVNLNMLFVEHNLNRGRPFPNHRQ